ncbi:MAG: glycine--tRNA ligase subunit beta [Actinobacteria bacterium]|nr:glycine--tRNA ligase subunit beta [Actinomycetota bacterium]
MEILLEIGTEELPASAVYSAMGQISKLIPEILASAGLGECGLSVYGTPRRLAAVITGIAGQTEARVIRKKGPPLSVAKDGGGAWTKAAAGFAKSQGVEADELVVEDMPGGSYVFAVTHEKGQAADDMVPGLMKEIVESLKFKKSMRWGDGEERFSRPVRWILAIDQDGNVLPFKFGDLSSSNKSYGHRYLSQGLIEITDPASYIETMKRNFVIVDPRERKSVIVESGERACRELDFVADFDDDVLYEVVQLVEWPGVIMGRFSEGYLRVPREVLVHSMEEHQRYFPVVKKNGDIANRFIAVHNGDSEHEEIIRNGNERVLAARLADAEFFFDEDLKTRLADRTDDLKQVVYKSELGSMYEKSLRLSMIAGAIGEKLKLDSLAVDTAKRAAVLAKCDLVTHMVNEFPGLQGKVGEIYAGMTGEDEGVAAAIGEQYAPKSTGDKLPESIPGAVLSIGERIDNLVSSFGLGHVPSGSEDPYGLRRQAAGMIMIMLDKEFSLSVIDIVRDAAGFIEEEDHGFEWNDRAEEAFREFLISREKSYYYEKDYRYDLVDAAIELEWDRPLEGAKLLEAMVEARESGLLSRLYTGFERCHNLSRGHEAGKPVVELAVEDIEKELLELIDAVGQKIDGFLSGREYMAALLALEPVSEAVDRLFDEVLIMDEDPGIRANRLSMLANISVLYGKIAEFSKLKWD